MTIDPTIPDEREDRLPRWAQQTLTTLRRRLAQAQTHAEEARLGTNPAGSDTLIRRFSRGGGDVGLGVGTRIRFLTDPAGTAYRRGITARVGDGQLFVQGDAPITVLPEASNSIRIELDGR